MKEGGRREEVIKNYIQRAITANLLVYGKIDFSEIMPLLDTTRDKKTNKYNFMKTTKEN